jgi:hypothetical protein
MQQKWKDLFSEVMRGVAGVCEVRKKKDVFKIKDERKKIKVGQTQSIHVFFVAFRVLRG